MRDLKDLSFDKTSLHTAYAGSTSPADVLLEALRRLADAVDPGIFLHLRSQSDLVAEATALPPFDPEKYPLWGLPFAIKDNIDLAGAPTTAACPAYAYEPAEDAFVVAALRAAGAIPLGKTNLDQFATGLVGVRTPHPVPRNAIDPDIVPGGSSSGSGVAVARGIVTFALGTDTAGSGRVPAALNNIVGLKPSLGALSARGVVPACRTLDTISIFALTVPDAWAAFDVAAQYDPQDAYARSFAVAPLGSPPPVLSIGIPNADSIEFCGDAVQAAAFAETVAGLKAQGAKIVELDFTPFYDVAAMLYEGAWVAERMTVIEDMMRTTPEAIHPVTQAVVGAADKYSAADAFRGMYRLADLKRVADTAMEGLDLLCVPTIPTFYSVADLEADPITPNSRLGTYTNFVNLMDFCGIAVPTTPRSDGRPGSVTLLARAGRDGLAAALAAQLHQQAAPKLGATQASLPPPIKAQIHAGKDEIAIAVVGAHMSGLPLNSQLTDRGARFLEATSTAPEYRFFALPGGPPHRPGLLLAPDGHSIDLEIWAMPSEHFGSFMAGIPDPLCIGTVKLADGRMVKGFLVEHLATLQAADITASKGWRGYLRTLQKEEHAN